QPGDRIRRVRDAGEVDEEVAVAHLHGAADDLDGDGRRRLPGLEEHFPLRHAYVVLAGGRGVVLRRIRGDDGGRLRQRQHHGEQNGGDASLRLGRDGIAHVNAERENRRVVDDGPGRLRAANADADRRRVDVYVERLVVGEDAVVDERNDE